jgi:hypothetical protein
MDDGGTLSYRNLGEKAECSNGSLGPDFSLISDSQTVVPHFVVRPTSNGNYGEATQLSLPMKGLTPGDQPLATPRCWGVCTHHDAAWRLAGLANRGLKASINSSTVSQPQSTLHLRQSSYPVHQMTPIDNYTRYYITKTTHGNFFTRSIDFS